MTKLRSNLGWILFIVASLGVVVTLLIPTAEGTVRGRKRPAGRASSGNTLATAYPNNFAINIPGANGDGVRLADAAGLEPTNGQMSWFLQWYFSGSTNSDAIISKFSEGAPNVAAFVIDYTACAGGFCGFRLDVCGETTCGTTPRVQTSPTGVVTPNEWNSVGMTMDIPNGVESLFVGGAEATQLTTGTLSAWQDVAAPWVVGNRSGNTNRSPVSKVKRITYWRNVTVSDQCMWEMANPNGGKRRGTGPIPASCPTPTSDCRGGDDNNGTGVTCTDHSGNGNDWTLIGTAAYSSASLPTGIPYQAANTNGAARKVVVFAGQSNNSGRALMSNYNPPPFAQRLQAAAWVSETTDAASSAVGDVAIMAAVETTGDTFNVGWTAQYNEMRMTNTGGTQGVGGAVAWEYCSTAVGNVCTVWTALPGLSDGTTQLTAARGEQRMSWTLPGDWVCNILNGSACLFFVRARITTVYTTNPLYDWIVGDDDLLFANRIRTGIYDNDGPIGTPNGTETPAEEPVDSNIGQLAVFPQSNDNSTAGPQLPALNALAGAYPSYNWYSVPVSIGGVATQPWIVAHGVFTSPYYEMETRITPAALGAGTEVVAIVVYHGESECNAPLEATRWGERWAYICEELRSTLADRDIPCIFMELPPTVPGSCTANEWNMVRAEQAAICNYLDHCQLVQAPDGPWIVDGIHLDHAAVRSLGISIGTAFQATALGQLITP